MEYKNICRYRIYSDGRVFSEKHNKFIKPLPNHKGYLRVQIYVDGRRYMKQIHRLVAELFIPNPNKYPQINHKDENKCNNNVSNLEWCTCKYNNTYGKHSNKIMYKDKLFNSQEDCAKYLGVSRRLVGMMLNGQRKNKYNLKYYGGKYGV